MTPEREIYLANRAKEVLENEAYLDAFALIKTEIENQWRSSPARDAEGREKLWLMQSLLTRLQATLETTMQSGKLAAADVQHKRTMAQRLKEFAA
jgi:hypothetical protein